MIRLRRSFLYIPADNDRALQKAPSLPADGYIIDLEDSVSPQNKDAARRTACEVRLEETGKEVVLRINDAASVWHDRDIETAREADVTAVLVPKVRSAVEVERVAAATGHTVWPMIETPQAILSCAAIAAAAAATGPAALVMGTNDLALELGVAPGPDRAELSAALQQALLAGKSVGLDVLDGVMNTLDDTIRLTREAEAGRALGMTGKTVIHPRQIGPVNEAFSPTQEMIAQASRVVDAVERAAQEDRAVATLDGRLVENLHARAAQVVLAHAAAIAERAGDEE